MLLSMAAVMNSEYSIVPFEFVSMLLKISFSSISLLAFRFSWIKGDCLNSSLVSLPFFSVSSSKKSFPIYLESCDLISTLEMKDVIAYWKYLGLSTMFCRTFWSNSMLCAFLNFKS